MAALVKFLRTAPGTRVYDDPRPYGSDFAQTLLEATPDSLTRTRVEISVGDLTAVLRGEIKAENGEMVGGRIDRITFKDEGENFQVWSDLGWRVARLMDKVENGGLEGFLSHRLKVFKVDPTGPTVVALADDRADEIRGSAQSDGLHGLAGGDRIKGHGGHDALSGGAGRDVLNGGNGDDQLRGGAHNDRLFGGNGYDNLGGGMGRDLLRAGDGDDFLSGGGGADRLFGGAGADRIRGGDAGDILDGGAGRDKLVGGRGADELYGGGGRDRLFGGAGVDEAYGGNGRDQMLGFDAGDAMYGGGGDDELWGVDGAQTLKGGVGDDVLYGGAGRDVFDFQGRAFGTDRADIDIDIAAGDGIFAMVEDQILLDIGASLVARVVERDGVRLYAFDVTETGGPAGTVVTLTEARAADDPMADAELAAVEQALRNAAGQAVDDLA